MSILPNILEATISICLQQHAWLMTRAIILIKESGFVQFCGARNSIFRIYFRYFRLSKYSRFLHFLSFIGLGGRDTMGVTPHSNRKKISKTIPSGSSDTWHLKPRTFSRIHHFYFHIVIQTFPHIWKPSVQEKSNCKLQHNLDIIFSRKIQTAKPDKLSA